MHAWPTETVQSIAERGHAGVEEQLRNHIELGAGTNTTIANNRAGWDLLKFSPHVLGGPGEVDTSVTFLGHEFTMPVVLCPVGPLDQVDSEGAAGVARAAAATGVLQYVAMSSAPSLEDVAGTVGAPRVFQQYWWGERAWIAEMAGRAEAAEYNAICLTVDTPAYGVREHDARTGYNQYGGSLRPNLTNLTGSPEEIRRHQTGISWTDIEWLRSTTELPLILKGVLRADDAQRAVEAGVDVIHVSNHGGRMLDHAVGAAAALAQIRDAVNVPIVVDGGIRSAIDVAKALALGATMVGLGRLYVWAFAAGGEATLTQMLELLHQDLVDTLTLLGARTIADLDRSLLG